MVIPSWPLANTVSGVDCIICKQLVPIAKATPGTLYADGSQAFACRVHLTDRAAWIRGWAGVARQMGEPSESQWYFEQLTPPDTTTMHRAIIRHVAERLRVGTAVIVVGNPTATILGLRKHAATVMRELAREQASTLDAGLRNVYSDGIGLLSRGFKTAEPQGDKVGFVQVVNPSALDPLPKHCRTVYLTTNVPRDRLTAALSSLQTPGLVVAYVPMDLPSVMAEAQAKYRELIAV